MACRGHPVRREFYLTDILDGRRGNIRNSLAHGNTSRGWRVQSGERRALTHSHRLTAVAVVTAGRHSNVTDRLLPGPDELVTHRHTTNAAIADMNQKRLVGNGGESQDIVDRILEIDTR